MQIIPPDQDEIEVSIFGPGKGESVAVHLGRGRWIVIDSCIDQKTRRVPVLDYLTAIGVDLAADVLAVVGTHAHDDHIAGISQVIRACRSAKFVCSSAQTSEEFLRVVELEAELEKQIRKGIREEYNAVFEELDRRFEEGDRPLTYAAEGLSFLEFGDSTADGYAVRSLSPSHYAFERAQRALARAFDVSGRRRKLAKTDPNEFAVAVWVEAYGHRLLLGADLTRGPAGCGWMGVLDSFHPAATASLFKVPHHGSPNAHHEGVWSDLLDSSPTAILAPYRGGRRPLPAPEDVERICKFADALYSAADSKPILLSRLEKKAAREIGVLGKRVGQPWGKCGQVRARSRAGSTSWIIETVPPAKQLGTKASG